MVVKKMKKKYGLVIFLLCAALVAESIFMIFGGLNKKEETAETTAAPGTQYVLTLSLDGMGESIGNQLSGALNDVIKGFAGSDGSGLSVSGLVKKFVYSDTVINALMSVSYPLLLRVLTDIELLDFATEAKLYAKPVLLAGLLENTAYTCCNSDGKRMPLSEVLSEGGEDWTYFDKKISRTDTDGKTINTTIWNTIKWNVTDENSFYSALNDMSEGLRGVLEVCLQNNEIIVNVNAIEAVTGKDLLPVRIDAASLFNTNGKSGYSTCLIPLFNMLGLDEGEYVSDEAFKAYTSVGDMWKAILDGVMTVIEKTEKDPVNGLLNMLVNFADSMEKGTLVESMRTLRLDADFSSLATLAMGYEDGLLSNLGDLLIEIIESLGIDFTHGFNALLDSLPGLIPSVGKIDIPDMDVSKLLAGARTKTLSSGNTVYVADKNKVIDYLIEYVIDEKIVQVIFDKTDFITEKEEKSIIDALAASKTEVSSLVNVIAGIVVNKMSVQA